MRRHRVSYHSSSGLKSLALPTALRRCWRYGAKKNRYLYLIGIIPDLSPFLFPFPAWRKIKNIFLDICTWAKSPINVKFLSNWQLEGKRDVWISQVRRVKEFLDIRNDYLLNCKNSQKLSWKSFEVNNFKCTKLM